MKVKVFNKNWSVLDVEQNKDKLFVYADNYMRIGKKGQSIIRDSENTVGLATKKSPNKRDIAYLNDKELEENIKNINNDILNIKYRSLNENRILIFSSGCYGNDLAMMPEKCPITYDYLNKILLYNFNFDNLTGKKIDRIPGYDEIKTAKYIHISRENKDIITVINNSFFIKSYLENNLISNYDLILSGKKIAFTHKDTLIFNPNDILIFKFDNISNYLVVRVSQSYNVNTMAKEQWAMFEGIDNQFILENENYIQTHFNYICILDSKNNMILPGDLFPSTIDNTYLDKEEEKEDISESIDKEESLNSELIEIKEDIINDTNKNEEVDYGVHLEIMEESKNEFVKSNNIEQSKNKEQEIIDMLNQMKNDFVTKSELQEYSKYLVEEISERIEKKRSFWNKLFGG
jgi:hypothetical protein